MGSKSDDKCAKKTNLLVYKTPTGQGKEHKGPHVHDADKQKFKIPICAPKPKQIRVCTGAEMKKMCPPKLCKCDKALPRRGGLMGLLGFGLKAALAAAAWYVTYDLGIWGTSDDTDELFRNYCRIVKGPCPEKPEKWEPVQCSAEKQMMNIPRYDPYAYCDEPPVNIQRKLFDLQNKWNYAVSLIFSGVAGFPYNIIHGIPGTNKGEKEENEECVPYSDLSEDEKEEFITNSYKK